MVESRIEFGCIGANARARNRQQAAPSPGPAEPIAMADCECMASDTVRTLGLPAATFATEEVRAQLVKALSAAVTGEGFSANRTPFMRAIEKLVGQSTKSLAICQKKRLGGADRARC